MLYFSPEGNLIGRHRKLKPTGSERLIWGEGDGSTLPVISTGFGNIGGSVIVAPDGEVLAGPLWDREGILYADLDLEEVTRAKVDLDVAGHYARPDIFQLRVNFDPQPATNFKSESDS